MDHTRLLYDIGELNNLFAESISIETFLQLTVEMVAKHLKADVCSIYIYNDKENRLVLKATHGLEHSAINCISMSPDEGLTGLALKELKPVRVTRASKHPRYKFFAGCGEEKYENFLAVPIRRGINRIGVLVLQRSDPHPFTRADEIACMAAASQLAAVIENARFLLMLRENQRQSTVSEPRRLDVVQGESASPGLAYGPGRVFDRDITFQAFLERRYERRYGLEDFNRAVAETEKQLNELQYLVEETLTDAASLIFATHLLLLKDHEFTGAMQRKIEQGENPPRAILKVTRRYLDVLRKSPNPAVREKVQDVEDLALRLLANLLGETKKVAVGAGQIILARNLFPSELLRMASEGVKGIVLATGGVTSHIGILARSLGIPLVVAENPDLLSIPDGTPVLVDGDTGNVHVAPAEEVVSEFQRRDRDRKRILENGTSVKPRTKTADGVPVHLHATINLLSDVKLALQVHCEGIGLYRTEFPFIVRTSLPSEEEQYVCYRRLVESAAGLPITFRTLDVGGDKVLAYFSAPHEQNPSLGMRSTRFALTHREVFIQQIRAILRAGADSDLRIMFPMIGSLEEFRSARDLTYRCLDALVEEGLRCHLNPKIGVMAELPSVVELAREFAREADFLSIGTNDLIQFMLGVDRTNVRVAPFYIPHHPSVLRALKKLVQAALEAGKEVAVCGDMAHQVRYLPFLLGIGVRILSIDVVYFPEVQQAIERIELRRAEELADLALRCGTAEEVEALLAEALPAAKT